MNSDPTSLDNLHDVIAPPATPWWPPSPGWQALLVFLGIVLVALGIRMFVRWQHRRYRREAIAELDRHAASLSRPDDRAMAVAGIARLLKRAALTAWPRTDVAALTGPAWMEFLDRTSASVHFRSQTGSLIEEIAYDPRKAEQLDSATVENMVRMVRHWLIHHRTESGERTRR